MIFCKLRQVSSNASMVNQVYGLGPTLKLLISASKAARDSKSTWADESEACNKIRYKEISLINLTGILIRHVNYTFRKWLNERRINST